MAEQVTVGCNHFDGCLECYSTLKEHKEVIHTLMETLCIINNRACTGEQLSPEFLVTLTGEVIKHLDETTGLV